MVLSKNAQNIQDIINKKGLEFKVVELSESTRTASEAAAAIGCEVAQIAKSLMFCTENSRQPVLVLASGANRVNEKKIEEQIGEKIVKADANFTKEITGFTIGGIPPFGHNKQIDYVFIDEDLLQYEELWAAAGMPNAVFCLAVNSLQPLTGGKIITIK